MIILNVEQGSDEWMRARTGIPTASSFDKIITSTGKASTQSRAYANKLVAEYFLQDKISVEQNEWMTRGIELEPQARSYYSFVSDIEINEVGIVYKDSSKMLSCSPDGLSNDRGLEIKCPAPHTHIEYLLADKLPAKYIAQVQGSMYVTGLTQWDFLSFHPELPPLLINVSADENWQNAFNKLIRTFIQNILIKRGIISEKMHMEAV